MTGRIWKLSLLPLALAAALALSACNKKVAKVTPPTPPPPQPVPSATLTASPSAIEQGQTTTLTWQTSNATAINIDGLGTVPASGSRSLTPDNSTTYTLTAKGPGGSTDTSARVTVNPKAVSQASPSDEELFSKYMKDVFFDFNKSSVRGDEVTAAQGDAAFLAQHPNVKVVIEGHCDDRGSVEYNLALGTSRAESVKESLQQQGISADRLKTISYGKERPFCSDDNEQCWQQNRVDHFVFEH